MPSAGTPRILQRLRPLAAARSETCRLVVFVALSCLAVPLYSQDVPPAAAPPQEVAPAEGEDRVFFEVMDVNVVNVAVWVTDKKGDPVEDLTRNDFEVFEDGRPVEITNFLAVRDGRRVSAAPPAVTAAAAPAAPPPAAPAAVPGVEPALPEDQRLHLIVYVDNLNIRPFNRNRVFRRLREFLMDRLDVDDRVMLVSFERSLHVRHPFTTDPNLIASALFDLEEVSGLGLHADSERRSLLREIDEAESSSDVVWRVQTYAQSQASDLAFSIDAMKEIITSMSGLPGRKAFLYVSDGLPMMPGEDLFYAINQRFQESIVLTQAREHDASRKFQSLAAQANTHNVTFYAIDAAGLRAPSASSVEQATASRAGLSSFVDSVYISNLQQPLLFLADKTGGQVIYNTNDVGPGLEKIAGDFKTYYSLGYTPAHSGTDRYYKIEVKVKNGKGLKVRHREGYRDQTLLAKMQDGTRSTLMYGFEDNPLGVALHLGNSDEVEKNRFNLPVAVAIPLDRVVLVPQGGFHTARLKIYFGAMDNEGGFAPVQEVQVPIRIPDDKVELAQQQPFVWSERLHMRRGPHRIAVGVWDEVGAEGSFVTKSVFVGEE